MLEHSILNCSIVHISGIAKEGPAQMFAVLCHSRSIYSNRTVKYLIFNEVKHSIKAVTRQDCALLTYIIIKSGYTTVLSPFIERLQELVVTVWTKSSLVCIFQYFKKYHYFFIKNQLAHFAFVYHHIATVPLAFSVPIHQTNC